MPEPSLSLSKALQLGQSSMTIITLLCVCHIAVQVKPPSLGLEGCQCCTPTTLTGWQQPQADPVSHTLQTEDTTYSTMGVLCKCLALHCDEDVVPCPEA